MGLNHICLLFYIYLWDEKPGDLLRVIYCGGRLCGHCRALRATRKLLYVHVCSSASNRLSNDNILLLEQGSWSAEKVSGLNHYRQTLVLALSSITFFKKKIPIGNKIPTLIIYPLPFINHSAFQFLMIRKSVMVRVPYSLTATCPCHWEALRRFYMKNCFLNTLLVSKICPRWLLVCMLRIWRTRISSKCIVNGEIFESSIKKTLNVLRTFSRKKAASTNGCFRVRIRKLVLILYTANI